MQHHGQQRPGRGRRLGEGVPPPTRYARTYRARGATVVELLGELDVGSAEYVYPHLEAAAQWPPPLLVVLDLGGLEFIDCYGLSVLLRARRKVVERGGTLRMVCDRPQSRRLLALTGLDAVFRPVRTLDDALAAPPGRAPGAAPGEPPAVPLDDGPSGEETSGPGTDR